MKKALFLFKIFSTFFKIGCFTFSGGLAMLPLIELEIVEKNKWATKEEVCEIFSLAQSLPGVIAVNTSIFIGKRVGGYLGILAAILGTVLPAFFSIMLLLILLGSFKNSPIVAKIFLGIKASSAALIFISALKLSKTSVKNRLQFFIALAAFVMIFIFNINPLIVITFGGSIGFFAYLLKERGFAK